MTKRQVKKVLIAVRRKISSPENWIRGSAAEDKNGRTVKATSPRAQKFCLVGAVYSEGLPEVELAAFETLRDCLPKGPGTYGSLAEFNDNNTHSDVIALLDKAIASIK